MDDEILQNDAIRVIVSPNEMSARVEWKAEALWWQFEPNVEGDVSVEHGQLEVMAYLREAPRKTVYRMGTPQGERVTIFLKGLPGGTGLVLSYTVPPKGAMLRVEVEPLPTGSVSRVRQVYFPGMLAFGNTKAQYTVWPNAAGMLLPNTYPQAIAPEGEHIEARLAFNRSMYQPWWGVIAERGAYLAIAETPFDFAFDVHHPAGGPTKTRPVWIPSLGHLAYPRSIRYVFYDQADHSVLAKGYRKYAQDIGRWMLLDEKFERNPNAKRLVGSTAFPVSICSHNVQETPPSHRVTPFEERTRQLLYLKEQLGRANGYLHVDGWGYRGYDNQHPDIFPPCPEAGGWEGLIRFSQTAADCGYLFGLHDQYRDYYLDGPQFAEWRAIKNREGVLPRWSTWAGGAQSVLCAKESLANIRRNFTELLGRGVVLTGSYLDVFAIVPMDECYDPAHPMTREDCFRWRAAGLDYVRSLGIAISSEEPVDCFIPHLDFAHWADYPRASFMKGDYLGIPVPLHSLVYHDALLLPAVFDYGSTRENRPCAFLEGLSQVEIPYGHINWKTPKDFQWVDILASLHAVWGTAELVGHKLLDAEGLVQQFTYPDGQIAIDLRELRYRIEDGPMDTKDWVRVGSMMDES